MIYHPISFDIRTLWPRRPATPEPPAPNPLAELHARVEALRDEFVRETTELRVELAGERGAREAEQAIAQRDMATANQAIADQRHLITDLQAEIDGRKTVEQQLRGELRESNTRIQALETQLSEERTARTLQAGEVGYLRANLDAADQRFAQQRTLIDQQGKQIAVLEEQNTQTTGKAASLALAVADLQKRLNIAYTRLKEAGLSVEGLT